MNRAVFLDRDGVLNEDPGFLHRLDELVFFPGVVDALTKLSQTDYKIIIVTNQAGIGRGIFTEKEYVQFEKAYLKRLSQLSSNQIRIDKVYFCPHHPEKGLGIYKRPCTCRKPNPGMLLTARDEFDLDLSQCFMVGDKRSDIQAGKSVDCKTILVKTGCGGQGGSGCIVKPNFEVKDLSGAVDLVVSAG